MTSQEYSLINLSRLGVIISSRAFANVADLGLGALDILAGQTTRGLYTICRWAMKCLMWRHQP